MAITYYQGIELAFLGYILVSSIQLGSTIDYAIIMTERYQDERSMHKPLQAVKLALSKSSFSIIISMLALACRNFIKRDDGCGSY